ncbi:DUF4240 domain-containing protein [Promicromonospora sp. NPDC023805]|uniref:DUF4240 domain-containing protein n=1 Tax=Promicromonospora sp. NPDC023805 TaxID=3154696 RepID=UPI0033DDD1FB
MDLETFWRLVGEIRDLAETRDAADDEALANCVVDVIADRLTADEILAFGAVAGDLAGLADLPAMEAAMFLIEGYISDDSFMDFREGLILLGREPFEAAIADPDSLAEHLQTAPVKGSADGPVGRVPIAFESITSCVADAWLRVTGTEDDDEFWNAAQAFEQCSVVPARPSSGEPPILHDADATRARLPRLLERFAQRFEPRATAPLLATAEAAPEAERATLFDYQSGLADGRAASAAAGLSNKHFVPGWGRPFWEMGHDDDS